MTWKADTVAWKCTEDAFLREHYRAKGAKFCADALPGRTDRAVERRAGKIGVRTPRIDTAVRITAQVDDAIRRAYQGERRPGFSKRCAERLGLKPQWVSTRAVALGLVAPRVSTPWSDAERAFVEANPMMPPAQLAKAMRKRGWCRTPVAIAFQRFSGNVAKDDPAFFSGAGLAMAMGVDTRTVTGWIRMGFLAAKARGTNRTGPQGGDTYIIHERDVARFVVEHVGRVSLAKIEPNKAWFIDLMARCAPATLDASRDKGRRIAALAEQRPELNRIQIAEMTDSTPQSVSTVLSRARRHDPAGAQA